MYPARFAFAVIVTLALQSFTLNAASGAGETAQLEQAGTAFATRDYARAVELYTPLAEQGNPDAMLALGIFYGNGLGVEPDAAQADKWIQAARLAWEESGQDGDPQAYASLGRIYSNGVGVAPSAIMAKRYFRRAAQLAEPLAAQGEPDAQYVLGSLYLGGKGVQQDQYRAIELLEKSASGGSRKAMQLLVYVFTCDCKGFAPDHERAGGWRQRLDGVVPPAQAE